MTISWFYGALHHSHIALDNHVHVIINVGSFFITETSDAQRVTNRIVDHYNALGNKLTFRKEELEAFLNLSKLFNDKLRSLTSQQDWLTGLEVELDTQRPLSNDIGQLEQQLRSMQVGCNPYSVVCKV